MGELKLGIKLAQQLVMTPQLQQAIKLLQMSRLELEQNINMELTENPVLEEDTDAPVSEATSAEIEEPHPKESETDSFDWQNYIETYDSNSSTPPSTRVNKSFDEYPNIENFATKTETLYEHLIWQLRMSGFTKKEEALGEKIIENINDDGYLSISLEEIAKQSPLSPEDAEEVLLKIQEFDPVGVGARTLSECLIQQVRQLNVKDVNLLAAIKNHLPDFEKKNYQIISKKLKITTERVFELAKIILSLEPKPGRAFSHNDAQYIVPDIYVFKVGEEYVIMLNDEGLPKLKISSYYRDILSSEGNVKSETKDYIQEKLRSAVALIRSIQHRQKTIYRVTEAIVKRQKQFMENGTAYLKPMILRDIATDISMHESTISRVTTNKYVHTSQGLFELKFFFNNPISAVGGGTDIASESVRERIRKLVENEDEKNPLSDQQIVNILKQYDIDIARRTVAKYREMMGILSSSRRKNIIN